jgi:iron complex outermembrane recepter protein
VILIRHASRPAKRAPRYPLIASAISLALGVPTMSVAADAAATSSDTTEEPAEIVVTANRREENVLDVPYNISAVSGEALSNAGVTNLTDISRMLPGVTIPDLGPRGNSSNSMIIIRGLNVNNPIGSAYLPWESVPTVSTYIDDVPLFVNLDLSDIQRIEVLRGPQGTLYGSGAVGGIVKVIHNIPDVHGFSAEATSDVSGTYHANGPSYDVKGTLNLPITDVMAFRLSAGYQETSGFINALNAVEFSGQMQPVLANPADPLTSGMVYQHLDGVDSAHSSNVRAAFLWDTTSWLRAQFSFDAQDDHSNGFSQQTEGYKYETLVLIPSAPDHRTVELEALTLTADAGFATVTSSSSYSVNKDENLYDESQFIVGYNLLDPLLYGNYPRITSPFYTVARDTSLTEELRLVSKESTTWDYTVGAFMQHQTDSTYQRESVPGYAAWSQLPGSASVVPAGTPGGPYANWGDYIQYYNGGVRPSADVPVDNIFKFIRNTGFLDRAFYGELTRHLTSKWQITAGARQFWQSFAQSLYQSLPDGGPLYSTLPYPENLTDSLGTANVSRQLSFRSHILKLNTSYAITDQMHAYATFSEGFRRGGINALPVGACLFCESESIVPYKSDTVKNYEVGLKGTVGPWLRYSGAIYREDWNNPQIPGFGQSGDPAVFNGKKAETQGLELELDSRLGGGWTAQLGYGLTQAKITEDFVIAETVNGATYILDSGHDGDRLPYVPRQTLTGELGYTHAFSGTYSLDAHLNAVYRSDVNTQLNSTVLGYRELGGFTTVNASCGMTFGASWHGRLFVNNLTNVQGVTSAGPLLRNYDDPRYRIESVSRPRTIGVGVDYQFK